MANNNPNRRFYDMASQFGDLAKLISDIESKVDSICRKKCSEFNLDEKKLLDKGKDSEKADDGAENVEESARSVKGGVKPKATKVIPPDNPAVNKDAETDGGDDEEQRRQEEEEEREEDERQKEKRLKKVSDEIERANRQKEDDKETSEKNVDREGSEDDYDKLSFRYEYSDSTPSPDIVPELNFDKGGKKKNDGEGGGVSSGLKKFGMKNLAKYGLKKGYGSIVKKGFAKTGAKAGARAGAKVAAKRLGKLGAKSASKKLPFGLGLIPAAAFAIDRATEGDFKGAGLELASGAAAIVPFAGTAGSLGIDAYLANRDVEKATGKSLVGHGMDKAGEFAGKYAENRIKKTMKGESFECFNTLYDRAKRIFESESGVNESVDGYCFDDYVLESKIDNLAVSREEIDESKIFFGYDIVCESFGSDEEELKRLFKKLSPDGKISMDDLVEKDSDMPDVIDTKKRIKALLGKRNSSGGGGSSSMDFNAKEYKKAYDMSLDQSGQPSNLQLWHKGLDQLGSGVAKGLERNFLIPQELSKKLNIPKNLGRLAGAGVGGLLFGPVGALAGTALANWMANSHEKYKAKQYAKYHGLDEKKARGKRDGYVGGLVGAGLGNLFGGPVGGILGAGVGRLLDRKTEANVTPARRSGR